MSRHRRAILIVVLAVVVAWGGVHLLSATPVSVAPATWPSTDATVTPSGTPSVAIVAGTAAPSPSAGGVPLLPGAMEQLNASTESTATGIWALLQELETALGQRLGALVGQLEPGR